MEANTNAATDEPQLESGIRSEKREEAEVENVENLKEAANEATEVEHHLTVKEAFSIYRMAAVWSVLFCVCIIMDGYDSDLITNLYGLPAFQRRYGYEFQGKYVVAAPWQTALAMSSPVGRVIGGLIQGPVAELIGRKRTLVGCLVLVTGFIFITFFAANDGVLCAGMMLQGCVWVREVKVQILACTAHSSVL